MDRGDLLFAFTKIHLWRLTQYRRIVYLDADVVSLRKTDELFDIEEPFAAASDVGWPDFFNTGVMSLKPNVGDYHALETLASSGDSFDGADQGLINQFYEHRSWHRLSFVYNCTPSANYQYEPAYRYHKSNIKNVHFIGKEKPWTKGRKMSGTPAVYKELLNRWWAVYDRHFRSPSRPYTTSQYGPPTNLVQSYVKGETDGSSYGYNATLPLGGPTPGQEKSVTPAEPSLSDRPEHSEELLQGNVDPTPTSEQRRFSAPQAEWDGTR